MSDKIFSEIDDAMKERKRLEFNTNFEKGRFISELKCGLGEQIKLNPNQVKIIKVPKRKLILTQILGLFKKIIKTITV
jgi:hypothetical protein